MYLGYAEMQAQNRKVMAMSDWKRALRYNLAHGAFHLSNSFYGL